MLAGPAAAVAVVDAVDQRREFLAPAADGRQEECDTPPRVFTLYGARDELADSGALRLHMEAAEAARESARYTRQNAFYLLASVIAATRSNARRFRIIVNYSNEFCP
jgi:hypothetical protein